MNIEKILLRDAMDKYPELLKFTLFGSGENIIKLSNMAKIIYFRRPEIDRIITYIIHDNKNIVGWAWDDTLKELRNDARINIYIRKEYRRKNYGFILINCIILDIIDKRQVIWFFPHDEKSHNFFCKIRESLDEKLFKKIVIRNYK